MIDKAYNAIGTLIKYINKYIIYLLLLELATTITIRFFFEDGTNTEKFEFILSVAFSTIVFRYFIYFILWRQLKNGSYPKRLHKFLVLFFTIGSLLLIFNPIFNYKNSYSIMQIVNITAILSGVARFKVKNNDLIEQKF